MNLSQKSFSIGKLHLTYADLAALIVFAALTAYFFLTAPYGLTESDEALYQVYELRLLKGDRLFSDDWTLTPFSTLFNFLPLSFFYTISGGSAGILLSLRYFFAGLKVLLFALTYISLRKNGFWAILAAVMAAGASPFGLKTLNYYYICVAALLFTGIILFVKKDQKPIHLISAGFVFSLAVLAEPSMAAIWMVYSVFVLIYTVCQKKNLHLLGSYDFVLSPRIWLRFFIGILLAAFSLVLVCALFFMRASPSDLLQGFLQALNDPERSGGILSLLSGRFSIISIYAKIFHPALFYSFILLLPAALIVHKYTKKLDAPFLILLGVLSFAMAFRLLTYPMEKIGYAVGESVCHTLPFCLSGIVFYAFTEKRDKRLFAFWLFGIGAVLCADIISMSAFGAVSEIGAVASLLLLRDLIKERIYKTEEKEKKQTYIQKQKRFFKAAFIVFLIFLPANEIAHYAYMANLHETETLFCRSDEPLDCKIEIGAMKGIITASQLKENYEKSVRDAEKLRSVCKNRLYVADLAPSVYLDADLPLATHSPYYYYKEGWERVSLWWKMHPEKRPDVIYIPFIKFSYMEYFDAPPEEKLEYLRSVADISVTDGEIGYIVIIERWK